MKSLFELYIQQFKTTMATMLQYRAELLIWMIGHVLEPLVYLVVWSVVSNGNGGSVGGYDTRQFAAYFILMMIVNQLTFTWVMYEFEYRIREGTLSFALLRPVHPIHSDIADNISSKLVTLPFLLAIAVILALVFHASMSPHVWAMALFVSAIFLAFLLRFFLEWSLAQAAFWTTRVNAINQAYFFVMLFLSGQIAPLTLLPSPVRVVAMILPFRWMISFPVELLMGRLTLSEALVGIAVQLAWVICGLVLLRVTWKVSVRNYSAVGA